MDTDIIRDSITTLQQDIHELAKAKGWWENVRQVPELIALMHSELSEGLECYRQGADLLWFEGDGKPEGLASELADCVIRILDAAEYLEIDLGAVILAKHEYNATRPYKHGKRC